MVRSPAGCGLSGSLHRAPVLTLALPRLHWCIYWKCKNNFTVSLWQQGEDTETQHCEELVREGES